MSGDVSFFLSNGICLATLHNSPRRNAVSHSMWEKLYDFATGPKPAFGRVVVLRGEGTKAFSAGADVEEFRHGRADAAGAKAYDDLVESTCQAIERIPVPTIALIHGACMGAGASLAASCDIRVTSDDAFFAVPAAKLGLGYDPRGIDRLSRVFGDNLARQILFTASRLPAMRAYEAGAVYRISTAEAVDADVQKLAEDISDNAPLTIEAAKAALNAIRTHDTKMRDEAERRYRVADASADYVEGRAAFAEKRRPLFRGV
ncbi:MAG TPA: enoyl-CoA hydratase-related protein [Xanthobacteraceae bacterium]|jgi:enoyl-CoA hydratase/carnithine racemase|nr:enoyl-CoA hydratase-related protein [Xanthobacteraceae bacterium]